MRLTERGAAIRAPLSAALLALREAVEPKSEFDPATHRCDFQLGTADYSALLLLPGLAQDLESRAKGMRLVARNFNGDPEEPLAMGQLDGAFLPISASLRRPSLRVEPLLEERFVCMVRKGHPVLRRRFTKEVFARMRHALIAPGGSPSGVVDDSLQALGLSRDIVLLIPHFLVAPFVVAETELVLTLPERIAQKLSKLLPVQSIEPPIPLPGFTMGFVWHEKKTGDPAHAFLRERVVRSAAALSRRSVARSAAASSRATREKSAKKRR